MVEKKFNNLVTMNDVDFIDCVAQAFLLYLLRYTLFVDNMSDFLQKKLFDTPYRFR